MISNEVATSPKPLAAAAFPGSPTLTHSMIPALALEPNGRQADAASQARNAFRKKRGIELFTLRQDLQPKSISRYRPS
jgi:hypothetical protein